MAEDFNDSPFSDPYSLGMFIMAAYESPAAIQIAIVGGKITWIVMACIAGIALAISPHLRWLVINERWFRRTMIFNLVAQIASFTAALSLGNKWLAVVGGGIALLFGALISLPWQNRLRKAHHIPNRFVG